MVTSLTSQGEELAQDKYEALLKSEVFHNSKEWRILDI